MNRTIEDSFTLRDALGGFVAIGGTDEEIARAFTEFFAANPDLRRPFEKAYYEMMRDRAHTFSEKYQYFIEDVVLAEGEARREFEEIWELATGTQWKW